MVAAVIAAVTCAIIFGLVQFVYPVFTAVLYAATAKDAEGLVVAFFAAAMSAMWAAAIALLVGIGSSVVGLLGGVIAGAVVGAIKASRRS